MRSANKKIMFLEGILLYVIVIFAVVEHTSPKEQTVTASQVQRDTEQEDAVDAYGETPKKVALTFDDGPHPVYTPLMLDGLKEKNVKATFFLLGSQVEQHPEIVKRIYEEGHVVGNHSYVHEQLSKLTDEQACYQVNRTNELIYEITGEYPQYLRPPFGDWKDNLDCEVTMVEVLWDIDPRDWDTNDWASVVEKVVSTVEENDIILMHDASESTVKAALAVIDRLKEEGYEFVTVDKLVFE